MGKLMEGWIDIIIDVWMVREVNKEILGTCVYTVHVDGNIDEQMDAVTQMDDVGINTDILMRQIRFPVSNRIIFGKYHCGYIWRRFGIHVESHK